MNHILMLPVPGLAPVPWAGANNTINEDDNPASAGGGSGRAGPLAQILTAVVPEQPVSEP